MKKYFLIVAAFFAAGISGCKKDYLSLEVNPNVPSVSTPQLTLAAALGASTSSVVNDYPHYGVWAGYWTTSGNYVPNSTVNQFQLTTGSLNGSWTDWYSQLTNYNILQNLAGDDASLVKFKAIAIIMKAYGFQHLVDDFGDVPYSQAFQPSTILFPAYDKAEDIYHDLGTQLDAAIALIPDGVTGTDPGTADIVFHGDMAKWRNFANSLKLRIALRVSTKTPGDPLVTGLAATTGAGYLTVDAASNPGYQNALNKQNPFYGTYGVDPSGNQPFGNAYYRANDFEVQFLNASSDPRAARFYSLVPPAAGQPASVVRGNIFGDTKATLLSNTYTSGQGPGLLKSSTQSGFLMLAAESYFLQAEAVNRGFITVAGETAQTLYEKGITASFVNLGLTAGAATTYYSQAINNVGWAASADKETAIITQKWIALTGLFNFEGWNEYRRTGIPAHPSSIDPAAVSATYPVRVLYPTSELNTNPTNLAKEGTIDPFSSKIFWAK
ncbi:MAG TPA: SusD/RagB family nutrient-binding outer membrane lipoprotein [Mucilaginibacter sp.]|nr:SusD/RagB family nutrient-binding outer membrane lipoprotein [Mucilaginibacter sp.]